MGHITNQMNKIYAIVWPLHKWIMNNGEYDMMNRPDLGLPCFWIISSMNGWVSPFFPWWNTHTHIAKNMQGPLRTLFGLYTSDFSCLLSQLIKDELNTNLLVQHIGSPFCLAWPPMVFINRCQLHHILDTLPKNSWLVPSPTKERIISELGLSQHRVSPIPMHYNL